MNQDSFIPQFEPWLDQEELSMLSQCIQDNWITGGKKVEEFENRVAKLCQVRRVVACNNGTIALYMALRTVGIGRGDEVIVPDFTFIASANAVILTGARPVFVDINKYTLNIDVKLIEQAITNRTRAIMPVHLYGQAADMDSIIDIAYKHELTIVEDAAQGIGVKWNDKPVGGLGQVGCLSFYADKTITTGEGGMVLTNSDDIADSCIRLSHQGNLSKGSYIHETIGYNFRMTDLQAAVGLAQLQKLDTIINTKQHNDTLYRTYLAGMREVSFPIIDSRCENVPFRTIIQVPVPNKLLVNLEAKGIGSKRVFYPLHKQPCYKKLKLSKLDYPNTMQAYDTGLALPSSAKLRPEQVEYICSRIKEFYARPQ